MIRVGHWEGQDFVHSDFPEFDDPTLDEELAKTKLRGIEVRMVTGHWAMQLLRKYWPKKFVHIDYEV
jgi:hypothetical protein